MPTYEYQCSDCKERFEIRQRFDSEPVAICPKCSGKSRRVIHSVPIVFKGSGFYCTDHSRGRVAVDNTIKKEETAASTKPDTEAKVSAGKETKTATLSKDESGETT